MVYSISFQKALILIWRFNFTSFLIYVFLPLFLKWLSSEKYNYFSMYVGQYCGFIFPSCFTMLFFHIFLQNIYWFPNEILFFIFSTVSYDVLSIDFFFILSNSGPRSFYSFEFVYLVGTEFSFVIMYVDSILFNCTYHHRILYVTQFLLYLNTVWKLV